MFGKTKGVQFFGAVVPDLESTDKFSAIRELARKAPIFQKIKKPSEFINAVFQREQEKTTGFGHGVAVAHGKIASVNTIKIALGVSREGISYNSADGKPVKFLFLVASPPDKSKQYLKILSSLMVIMRNKEFRNALMQSTPEEVESLLTEAFAKNSRSKNK